MISNKRETNVKVVWCPQHLLILSCFYACHIFINAIIIQYSRIGIEVKNYLPIG